MWICRPDDRSTYQNGLRSAAGRHTGVADAEGAGGSGLLDVAVPVDRPGGDHVAVRVVVHEYLQAPGGRDRAGRREGGRLRVVRARPREVAEGVAGRLLAEVLGVLEVLDDDHHLVHAALRAARVRCTAADGDVELLTGAVREVDHRVLGRRGDARLRRVPRRVREHLRGRGRRV